MHFAAWIGSLTLTSVGSSVVLVSTQPIFGVILSRLFLKEAAAGRTIAGILVSLVGTAVIASGDLSSGSTGFAGDLLALAGAVFAAGYFLIGRGLRNAIPFGPYLAGVYGAGAALLSLAFLVPVGGPASLNLSHDLPWLILMAAGPGVAGHGLLNWSVRRVRAYVVNAALLGEPVLATLYAWGIFGEAPGPHLLAGGALVVGGLAWVLREEVRGGILEGAL